MSIAINKLEIENVKRIKAVKVEPSPTGLTVIGGNNNQGKTSVLDSIAWALGGNRFKPSKATREGSVIPPSLKITMSNGLIVERKGKNSSLKVIDPNGNKGGQQLLDSFVEELAINLPKFMESTAKEKADTLLQIIGVGPQLAELEIKEKQLYDQRHAIGVIADQKEKFAKEQTYYPDAPKELVSIADLIAEQQEVLAKNGENARKRQNASQIQAQYDAKTAEVNRLSQQLVRQQELSLKPLVLHSLQSSRRSVKLRQGLPNFHHSLKPLVQLLVTQPQPLRHLVMLLLLFWEHCQLLLVHSAD